MTWQRIDENTYIDDTLVTCAEYQLFIDEMFEQGKYYQPDHWSSYQFPHGTAHEPILGVRYSDALAFCEWLTKRDGKEWNYRLPVDKEALEYGITSVTQLPLGYWIGTANVQNKFGWVSPVPRDPRNISRMRTDDPRIDGAIARAFALDLSSAFSHKHTSRLDRAISRIDTRDLSRIHGQSQTVNRAINRAIDYVRSLRGPKTQIQHMIDLIIDLYTLQERIAGRSPAFEGIRLVKKRIR